MGLNRIVALLTPIFAGLAGAVVQWIAENFPGAPQLSSGELTAVFVAGAAAAAAAALKWLHGWQTNAP